MDTFFGNNLLESQEINKSENSASEIGGFWKILVLGRIIGEQSHD